MPLIEDDQEVCWLSDDDHIRIDNARWWAAATAHEARGDLDLAAMMRDHGLRSHPALGCA